MQARKATIFAIFVATMLLSITSIASAGAFTAVIAYGDSLSDNGNLFNATGQPPFPYWKGHFSDGPVGVEYLATSLNIPLHDFAWGGATSGVGNYLDGGSQTTIMSLPGMIPEVMTLTPRSVWPHAPTSLFVVWGGANDYFLTPPGSVSQAVTDIVGIVDYLLFTKHATHVLVPGMPDLGLTPDYNGSMAATQWSQEFNAGLTANLPAGATYFDTYGFMHNVVNDMSAYGFSDVTDPCFNGMTVCGDPSKYLFWDGVHPTTTADTILAGQFYKAVTPEPSTILMLGTGIAGLAGVLRRKLAA